MALKLLDDLVGCEPAWAGDAVLLTAQRRSRPAGSMFLAFRLSGKK
jgi:hypothetical protein